MNSPLMQSSQANVPQDAALYSCKIALDGDIRQIVVRQGSRLCTLPEIYLLTALHGNGSVTDVIQEDMREMTLNDIMTHCEQWYGSRATKFFSQVSITTLPLVDHQYPDRETMDEAEKASAKVMLEAARKPKTKPKAKPKPAPVEDDDGGELDDL